MPVVDFFCNFKEETGRLNHSWENIVGSCHAPLALRSDWQSQLKTAHEELGFRYVRFHGILCDDVGTLIIHNDKPLYSFFNADALIDYLLSIQMKPFVELSFMPGGLASGRKTVFHYRGNVTPPKSYSNWNLLIRKLVNHWKERYGSREVRQWYFEVWNEPNLKAFWTGSMSDYFKLYQYSATAIKSVDSQFRVGGPATAKNEWIEKFRNFCEKTKTPVDFISTHQYPTDAFGKPGDDTILQLASSRRSVLREQVQDARRQAGNKPLFYTEWSSSSNPRDSLHDETYAAAFVTKTVLEVDSWVDGYSYWTFSDIFEENYFPSLPFHGGFGLLNLQGVRKPTYRAFELLHRLGRTRLLVDGTHETVDCSAIKTDSSVQIVFTNHAYPMRPIEAETAVLHLRNCPPPLRVYSEVINKNHANPRRRWIRMGSPQYPSSRQLETLHQSSTMSQNALNWSKHSGEIIIRNNLLPHSVALVTVEIQK